MEKPDAWLGVAMWSLVSTWIQIGLAKLLGLYLRGVLATRESMDRVGRTPTDGARRTDMTEKVPVVGALIKAIDDRWATFNASAWTTVPLGVSEEELSVLAEMPYGKAFRQQLWAARELFRARTGRQIVSQSGFLVVLSAEEQAKYARKHRKKARIKARRALDVAARVPLDQLPEAERAGHAKRVEKMAHLIALDEIASRKRSVLSGLGDDLVDALKARAEEARNRATAWEKLFR